MYSQEQRVTAIQLYIKYNKHIAPVIRELGYPSRQLLPLWYKEYKNEQEGIFKSFVKKNKYTKEERDFAIQHYLSHGKNITDTARTIGYPSRNLLSKWVNEDVKSKSGSCVNHSCLVRYTQKEKEDAIIDLTLRTGSAEDICKKRNISRGTLFSSVLGNHSVGERAPLRRSFGTTATLIETTYSHSCYAEAVQEHCAVFFVVCQAWH